MHQLDTGHTRTCKVNNAHFQMQLSHSSTTLILPPLPPSFPPHPFSTSPPPHLKSTNVHSMLLSMYSVSNSPEYSLKLFSVSLGLHGKEVLLGLDLFLPCLPQACICFSPVIMSKERQMYDPCFYQDQTPNLSRPHLSRPPFIKVPLSRPHLSRPPPPSSNGSLLLGFFFLLSSPLSFKLFLPPFGF